MRPVVGQAVLVVGAVVVVAAQLEVVVVPI